MIEANIMGGTISYTVNVTVHPGGKVKIVLPAVDTAGRGIQIEGAHRINPKHLQCDSAPKQAVTTDTSAEESVAAAEQLVPTATNEHGKITKLSDFVHKPCTQLGKEWYVGPCGQSLTRAQSPLLMLPARIKNAEHAVYDMGDGANIAITYEANGGDWHVTQRNSNGQVSTQRYTPPCKCGRQTCDKK